MVYKMDTSENKKIKLSEIFIQFFTLSLFAFGGGSTVISMIEDKFVDNLKWLNEDDMGELLAIVQSAPGATAINLAVLIAYKKRGIKGAIVGVIASVLPPFVAIILLLNVYKDLSGNVIMGKMLSGVKAAAAAIILVVVCKMIMSIIKKKNLYLIILFITFFILSRYVNINVMVLMVASIIIGILITFFKRGNDND